MMWTLPGFPSGPGWLAGGGAQGRYPNELLQKPRSRVANGPQSTLDPIK